MLRRPTGFSVLPQSAQPPRPWTSPTTAGAPPLLISDDASPPLPPRTTSTPTPRLPSPPPTSASSSTASTPAPSSSSSASAPASSPTSPRSPPPSAPSRHRRRRSRRRRPPRPRPPLPRHPAASTFPFASPPPHLLRGLSRNALPAHALSLFLRLAAACDPSLLPDNFTYTFPVSAVSAGGGSPIPVVSGFQGDALKPVASFSKHIHLALLLHGFSIKAALDANPLVATALVTIYARLNEMELARRLFDEMPVKNLASWNAMISVFTCFISSSLYRCLHVC